MLRSGNISCRDGFDYLRRGADNVLLQAYVHRHHDTMKTVYLGIGLVLALAATQASADTQCRKSAAGDVSCQRVHEDSALDSETTDQDVDHPTMDDAQPQADDSKDKEEKPQGGEVGDESIQSGDPGITY